MPFRDIIDPAVRAKMTAAYDLACARLEIDGSDPRSGELAKLIIKLGNGQDPEALCEQALAALQNGTLRKPKLALSVLKKGNTRFHEQ